MFKHFPIVVFLLVFTLPFKVNAQKVFTKSNVYAVVIGITNYENKTIPPLSYADKDARLFADWLKNNKAQKVAEENLKLFLNEDASISNIYESFNWLKKQVKKDDYVFLYYSGHGDIETDTLNSKGYLLAWNSPANNYRNNAIAVADLNDLANSLTTLNQAKVIIITDACHSGKLAGDFYKGRELTARNLNLVLNNQVRFAACQANELAAEGPGWGGGRGVFSYYLLKGLEGFARPDTNGLINVENLETYLDSSFKTDEGLKIEKHIQHPLIDGSPIFPLTLFDSATLSTAKNKQPVLQNAGVVNSSGLQSLKSLGEQPIDYFFAIANKADLDTMLDYKNYVTISPSEIPLKMVSDYLDKLMHLKKIFMSISKEDLEHFTVQMNTQLFERNELTIQNLQTQLQKNNFLAERFNEILVQLVHKKCQTLVNAYLNGDLAELEKRQYYNTQKNPYQNLLALMQVAINLTPENNYLYKILNVNKYYLTGLEMRMQMALSKENADKLLQEAFAQQQKALLLEPFAAYIQNELGNLYMHKNNFDSALYYFNYASALAPTWAIPYSNKIRLYFAIQKPKEAYLAMHIADSLEPNLAFVNVNAGLVMEKDSNWLAAETYYLNAITQNKSHYLPYERLGFVYINTGDYSKANTYFTEAKFRKNSFAVNDKVFQFGIEAGGLTKIPPPPSEIKPCNLIAEEKIKGWENYIALSKVLLPIVETSRMETAQIKNLNTLLIKDSQLPFAAHYLGKEYFQLNNYSQAEILLKQAIQNQIPEENLSGVLSLKLKNAFRKNNYRMDKDSLLKNSCLLTMLQSFAYDNLEDYYMLAKIYELNNNFSEALNLYKLASKIENELLFYQANYTNYLKTNEPINYEENYYKYELPKIISAPLKMAKIYEQLENYDSAENTLLNQVNKNREAGFARQAQIDKGNKGVTGSSLNLFWLAANEDYEAASFNFYSRMLAKFPRDAEWYKKAGLFLYKRLILTYNQIPLNEREEFYKYSLNQPYPYRGGEEDPNPSPEFIQEHLKIINEYELPVTQEKVNIEMQIYDPLKTAENFINSAIKYSGEEVPEADLILCLAHLYSWMGNCEDALKNYNNYLKQKPEDVIVRNELLNYLNSINNYVAELQQLNILNNYKALNKDQILKFAHYKILSNKDYEALLLLKNYKVSNKADSNICKVYNMQILINEGAYLSALSLAKDTSLYKFRNASISVAEIVADTLQIEKENYYNLLYTQIRLYTLLNENKTAIKLVKNLLDSTVDYGLVIKYDPVLKKIRNKKSWKRLVSKYDLPENELPAEEDAPKTWKSSLNYRIPKSTY